MEDKTETNKKAKKDIYSNGGNILIRVANILKYRFINIDKKRKERELNKISDPKKTELITRHKSWNNIEEDIINFDTRLEGKIKC